MGTSATKFSTFSAATKSYVADVQGKTREKKKNTVPLNAAVVWCVVWRPVFDLRSQLMKYDGLAK